ncbi:LacI family transcriptional regulator [Enemella dayhoffiae]|uniref:LacI family transcriptional regulator n=1 Tax=Enemella dayhoffiae TaxID=2016507 RepID=A0A255GP59_9ACTN|nr:LacI family DNA-binding transcriptional regulator [Enemella dayhoffiae]OYO17192.1 LacI family transcriptional regulator [Enemella dayhoffiae]
MSRVTIKTVAKAVGVSAATVSNAYNKPDQLSAALRERVLAKAAELGYDGPNAAAQSLRSGRANAIGVLLSYHLPYAFSDPFAVDFLAGLSEACSEQRAALVLLPLAGEPDQEPDLGALRRANIDGLTEICLTHVVASVNELTRRRGLPFVGTFINPDNDYVAIDDVDAGRLLGEHLHRLGHRDVTVLWDSARPPGSSPREVPADASTTSHYEQLDRMWVDRFRGVAEGMPGARFRLVEGGINSLESGRTAGAYALDQATRSTAIVCMSDVMALGVLDAMRARGLSAPGDVSVCGIDDIAAATSAGLTTVHQPSHEKGLRVGRLLLDPSLTERQVILPVELVVRRSTGPAPRT